MIGMLSAMADLAAAIASALTKPGVARRPLQPQAVKAIRSLPICCRRCHAM